MADTDDANVSNNNDESNDTQVEETERTEEETTETTSENDNDSSESGAEENEARFARLEATLERVLGEISSIREAQGIMVENGAVISESEAMDFGPEEDSFIPPAELDLLI
jgi:hypothetical protein